MDIAELEASLAEHGLCLRGGFDFSPEDVAPRTLRGRAASALLVGNAGGEFWRYFDAWRKSQPAHPADPLDAWSRMVITPVAGAFGASAVYPSDRPFQPFQQWAMRAEKLRPSPLGILMHPRFGLWHAYRAALLFDHELDLPVAQEVAHLCDACEHKPCLRACPVAAHRGDRFAHKACLDHLHGLDEGECMSSGCRDRNACPQATEYRYGEPLQQFLMAAFAA